MLIKGDKKRTVTIIGCCVRNYVSDLPITIENKNAVVRVVVCIDKHGNLFNYVYSLKQQ